MFSFREVPLLG